MIKSVLPPIDLSILPDRALAALALFVDVADLDTAGERHAEFATEVRAEACRRFTFAHRAMPQAPANLTPDLLDDAQFLTAALQPGVITPQRQA